MTDIMKLADDYAQHKYVNGAEGRGPDAPEARTGYARAALQSAIEALQAENERLQSALAQCRDAFPIPAQGSPLEQDWAAAMGEPESVPDFVKASLDAMGKGEPVGFVAPHDLKTLREGYPATVVMLPSNKRTEPLYAAPKALAPLAIPTDVLEAAVNMQTNHYRGPLAWAVKVIDFVADHGIGGTP